MLIFISGWYNKDVRQADGLHSYLGGVWQNRGLRPDKFFRYDQLPDIAKFVNNLPPTEPLGVVGFSYGGDSAARLGLLVAPRTIDIGIYIDPVRYASGAFPSSPRANDPGLSLTNNVKLAHCWHRGEPRGGLWCVPILNAQCEFHNHKFNPTPGQDVASAHGEMCRKPEPIIAIIKAALAAAKAVRS